MFQSNIDIIRLATGKKIQVCTQLYLDLDLSALYMLLCKNTYLAKVDIFEIKMITIINVSVSEIFKIDWGNENIVIHVKNVRI